MHVFLVEKENWAKCISSTLPPIPPYINRDLDDTLNFDFSTADAGPVTEFLKTPTSDVRGGGG